MFLQFQLNQGCSTVSSKDLSNTTDSVYHFNIDKMIGDYYRYIAEFSQVSQRDTPKQQAESAYRSGMEAINELAPVNPIRLALILNFSVFFYEIMVNYALYLVD